MSVALRLSDVGVSVGGVQLLEDVSLDVDPGCIVAIIGPNGAGKTTLLDAVSGMVGCTGAVEIFGDTNGYRPGTPRPGVGRVFQGSPLPETLTVAEILVLAAGDRSGAGVLLDRFGLRPHATSFVAELSTGMRRILDLAVATVGSPKILLLDEPASGLAQSEVELLAGLLVRWRDATGCTVLLVEHDAWLVRRVADRVVVMDGGHIVAQGKARTMLAARPSSVVRLHSPQEEHFREALAKVATEAKPAPPPVRRTLSKWTLMRLGLREFSAGLSAVLILGVLNRVMKVELGISLGVVATILASYNLAAPLALTVGHRSDTHPIRGRRRTPYIIGGAIVTGLAVAGAPHLARALAGGVNPAVVIGGLGLFIAMGIGMYGSGTVFFALIADLAPAKERGHAASVVYIELLAGILFGVALTGAVLKQDASNLGALFALAGVLVVAFTTLAVWGMEKRIPPAPAGAAEVPRTKFFEAVRGIAAIPQARTFFVFMVLATLFLFLQQAVLEPFGGEVLGLSIRATSTFNAVMSIGTVIGMVVAGRPFAEQYGHRKIAVVGLSLSALTFAGLALAAVARAAPPAWFAIFGIGLATGLFNVATLALMMSMADRARTALFMGTWTVAHAIADGIATAGGGVVYEAFHRLSDSVPGGYASVFAIEAIGLALCMPLLRGIDPDRFALEAGAFDAVPREHTAAEMGFLAAEPVAASLEIASPVPEDVTPSVARAARASAPSRQRSAAKPRPRRTGAGS